MDPYDWQKDYLDFITGNKPWPKFDPENFKKTDAEWKKYFQYSTFFTLHESTRVGKFFRKIHLEGFYFWIVNTRSGFIGKIKKLYRRVRPDHTLYTYSEWMRKKGASP